MIILKSREEIEKIRTASRYALQILLGLKEYVGEGVKTAELEARCEEQVRKIRKYRGGF